MLNAIARTPAFWHPGSLGTSISLVAVRQCHAGVWSSRSSDTTSDAVGAWSALHAATRERRSRRMTAPKYKTARPMHPCLGVRSSVVAWRTTEEG
jgi:hypothetical protein